MQSGWVKGTLILAMVLLPRLGFTQCAGGMMGGGHDQRGGHDHGTAAATKSESREVRKVRQDVGKLLAGERSRALLMEELFADPEFMRALIGRIAEAPEWRTLFLAQLDPSRGKTATSAGNGAASREADPTFSPQSELYRCPMHPEVTSTSPGACPKCGMALKRVE